MVNHPTAGRNSTILEGSTNCTALTGDRCHVPRTPSLMSILMAVHVLFHTSLPTPPPQKKDFFFGISAFIISVQESFHQLGPLGRSVKMLSYQAYSLLLVKFWLNTRSKEFTKKLSLLKKTCFTKNFLYQKLSL